MAFFTQEERIHDALLKIQPIMLVHAVLFLYNNIIEKVYSHVTMLYVMEEWHASWLVSKVKAIYYITHKKMSIRISPRCKWEERSATYAIIY